MITKFQKRLPQADQLFIPFIMAGDPHPDVTVDLAVSLQEAGAHVLELGVPYSDPLADGPVIQKAAQRALENKMTLQKAMELVPKMRKKGVKIPILIFTYYNPVLQLGESSFFSLAQENDIDGLLIPDIPFEESEKIRKRCADEQLAFISLVAPTSNERIEKIASQAKDGFLYCVSSLGVTGVRKSLNTDVFSFLEKVKSVSSIPIAVGFGISSYEQVQLLKDHCDGVIVGSAIVQQIEKLKTKLLSDRDKEAGIQEFKEAVQAIISPSHARL